MTKWLILQNKEDITFLQLLSALIFIIINAKNASSYEYIVKKGSSIFRMISENFGDTLVTINQNSLNDY